MKTLLAVLLVVIGVSSYAISIYDIQYTSVPGMDNTYPSPYLGKSVTVDGVVTASGYRSGGFFISEPTGGMWRSILVLDKGNNVEIGYRIQVTGIVGESFGMTCIQNIDRVRILEQGHPLPQPLNVTTGQLSRPIEAEAYEGALVRLVNATCSQSINTANRFSVSDGTGLCFILTASFSERSINLKPKVGDQFSSITGIVSYSFGEYSVSPRNRSDAIVMQPVFNHNRSWGRIKSIYK